ncbi:hypothetical protein [Streptomyces hydrogenans]
MTWLRAFGEVVRSGLKIEETRLKPRSHRVRPLGAIIIGTALSLASPA